MAFVLSRVCALSAAAAIFAAAPTWAQTSLWTVQAVNAGDELVCDAFASGAAGRSPYEFRLRHSKTQMLLIVSYDGPEISGAVDTATIAIGASVMQLPASPTKFGARPAVVVSLDPKSVDLRVFDSTVPFNVSVGGADFKLATLASDHVRQSLNQCAGFIARK